MRYAKLSRPARPLQAIRLPMLFRSYMPRRNHLALELFEPARR
jgi:hypothetical protein